MPVKHWLVANIEARIARKKHDLEELKKLCAGKEKEASALNSALAALEVEIVGIEAGIQDDDALLSRSAPKVPRVRKSRKPRAGTDGAEVKTFGDQIGQSAQEE